MKRIIFALLALLLLTVPQLSAPAAAQQESCLFFTETGGGEGGFSVCDDADARFRTAFENWGLLSVGYPISQRYTRDGFVTQAFQKAIMQWRADTNSVALVNIFDDLHNSGFDQTLLERYQTPNQLPAGWDGDIEFSQVVQKRQALLDERPALHAAYFASDDPLTFFGLPTSLVQDMDSHYAIRLQRAVLQEWKIEVPWAKAGEVTIANGGDIAKTLGGLPAEALTPQASAPAPSEPIATGCRDNNSTFISDVTIPDDTVMVPGERFVKTWRFQNNGSCPWTTSYQFVFIGDEQMSAPPTVSLNQEVQANGTIDISVNFTTPTTPGTYRSTWQLSTPEGTRFGATAYVQIVVADENAQPEPTAVPSNAIVAPNYFRYVIDSNDNSITGIVANGSQAEIRSIEVPYVLPFSGSANSSEYDYAPATNRVLHWSWDKGGGPSNLAVGPLHLFDVNTGENRLISEEIHLAVWAPNGQDFGYIIAKPDRYELRWRTAAGDDKLLARDVVRDFSVSPSGQMVAFARESRRGLEVTPGLYVVDISTGAERRISTVDREGMGGGGPAWGPIWSPDEKSIFLQGAAGKEGDLTWAATDGSFSHGLAEEIFSALGNQPGRWCSQQAWLLSGNRLLNSVGSCNAIGAIQQVTHIAVYELDATTGSVNSLRLIPADLGRETFQPLLWNESGESVFLYTTWQTNALRTVSLAP